ncbi:TIR domain-containing protein [Gottfriedia solisilvae]|uniref:Thoeris protein ThsB TIR-like domain-containing protein n=1 Tax=Gottfriedia solisilvae TaxID=1516104 RepID=A0A8J3F225_9BACI|nr:TIR domain-containing protein [Gottfriedia solisilvae]GGI17947.1 hypothetical protein GCM10007380_40480 [Gottfriedia solisilvae]
MVYRNGTYIAFAADGQTDPTKSDIKYYNIFKGWKSMDSKEFNFVNSHDKVAAVRDSSKAETIKRSLRERINRSKNMLLLIGKTTKMDDDFVPYEINYAIRTCKLPIIVCYVEEDNRIVNSIPDRLKELWPNSLKVAMEHDEVKTIHIPLKEKVIVQALKDFSLVNQPKYSIGLYKKSVYDKLNIY